MSRTHKHRKRWKTKQETDDWFCLDRFFELNTPSKSFKKGYRRSHKAKAKQAIRNGNYESIPEFKRCHKYNWLMEW